MIRSAVLFFSLLGFVFAGSGNDPPDTTYHRIVSEVRVTLFATDENNRPVESLGKDDFAIVDGDMVVREFRSLTRSDETALDVLILLDTSESVSPDFQSTMNDVLQLASQKWMADDQFSILSFSGLQSFILCTRNCRSFAAVQKLLALKAEGATPLFDALAFGAHFIASRRTPGVRPVLILFSDGNDTISKTSPLNALHEIVASSALLYAIDMNLPGSASRGSLLLRRLAAAAGGRYIASREAASDVLQVALEDLRNSYVVTYRPPRPVIGFHALRILPKHNLNLRFHCRNGYYYGDRVP